MVNLKVFHPQFNLSFIDIHGVFVLFLSNVSSE
jgi:hypothetical protein